MFSQGQAFHLFEISEFEITRVNCIRKQKLGSRKLLKGHTLVNRSINLTETVPFLWFRFVMLSCFDVRCMVSFVFIQISSVLM